MNRRLEYVYAFSSFISCRFLYCIHISMWKCHEEQSFFFTHISASVGVSTFYIWLQRRYVRKSCMDDFCVYGNGCKYKIHDSMLILHTHASNCTFCIELEGSRAVWYAGNEGYTRFSLYVLYIILLVTESL